MVDSEDGVKVRLSYTPRRQLEGFNFMDLASDETPFWPRVTTLRATGAGWVDFTRQLEAITLFGDGFGELIKPQEGTRLCKSWQEVPKDLDYLAVSNSDLCDILKKKGSRRHSPWRLVGDIYWHQPDKAFESCQCAPNSSSTKNSCDRIQVLLPARFPGLWSRSLQSPSNLPDSGAVIFGHSWKFPLRWGERGDPEEGQSTDDDIELMRSFQDSGLGSSLPSNSSASNTRLSQSAQMPASGSGQSKKKKGLQSIFHRGRTTDQGAV